MLKIGDKTRYTEKYDQENPDLAYLAATGVVIGYTDGNTGEFLEREPDEDDDYYLVISYYDWGITEEVRPCEVEKAE